MKAVRLYGYWRSSSAWRVRIGLNLKGIEFETVAVHLTKLEQRAEDYAALNPLQQVPTLAWEDHAGAHRLSQSVAILRFLDGVTPEPAFEPSDPRLRARAWQMTEIINAGIQPLQNFQVLNAVEALGGDRKEWGRSFITRGFTALEAVAKETARTYLAGEALSIADVLLVPQMYNARRFGVDLDAFPTLARVDAHLSTLPAFVAAHPDRQPDAPKEQ